MDFAVATLVSLAEETGMDEVFTLDRRGFIAYRIHGKKLFKVWPE
jgi:predicted nucleic acid-binding protein